MTSEPSVVEDDVQEISVGQTHPWLIACLVGVVLALIFPAVVVWFFEPEYEATALIQICSATPYLAFPPDPVDDRTGQLFVKTQIELLRCRQVLGPVLSQSDIRQLPELEKYHDPIRALTGQIMVRRVGDSELYNISLSSTDPKAAADTLNAVVDS